MHQRADGDVLTPVQFEMPKEQEFFMEGGGLYGTAADYLAFGRMILNDGTLPGARVLRPETVALTSQNHIGTLDVGVMRTRSPPCRTTWTCSLAWPRSGG